MFSVIMYNVIMLSINMLIVIIPSVVMLSRMAILYEQLLSMRRWHEYKFGAVLN